MRADHSCHCVCRPEHHSPSRSNRVRRRVRDKPATQHRRSPGSRETGASSGGRNPAEQHPIPIHPLGAPWPPRSIQRKMLIAISESRRPRRNSVRYPVNAGYNVPSAFAETRRDQTFRPHPRDAHAEVLRTKEVVHIDDARSMPPYLEGDPRLVVFADLGGARTFLITPMIKENELIGTIGIYRQEVRPFTDKQIKLVKY